jgi:hypothetical protein
VNGDGRPDLLTANANSNNVSVLLNQTAPGAAVPTFAAASFFPVGSLPQAVVAADVNGDGRPDLLVANANSNNVSVLLNIDSPPMPTPTATRTLTPTLTPGATPTPTRTPTATATPQLNCTQRPRVSVTVQPSGGTLQVGIAAGTENGNGGNRLQALQFTRLTNATVEVAGPPATTVTTAPTTVTLTGGPASTTLTVIRTTAGQASTAELVVTDGCGAWPTFVGGGPGAF